MIDRDTGDTILPPVAVRNFQGVRVAFIGLTLEGTPGIVSPAGIASLDFLDEADAINAIVPLLRQINIEAIVVLLHQGGYQVPGGGPYECGGEIVDIVERTDSAVDLFITGHTHRTYVCLIDGRLVTSSWSYGRLFTQIDVELNRVTKDLTPLAVGLWFNTRDVEPAADVAALIDKYDQLAAPIANIVVGTVSTDITSFINAAGESALGDVVADAHLAATAAPGLGDSDVAFMNSGGIRAHLTYLASGEEGDGEVTFAEAFAVHPFGNTLVTISLTGAQIDALLEQQFTTGSGVLQVSQGFEYQWSASAPAGSKIDPTTIKLDGVPMDPDQGYRITVPDFLADGGGNYTVLLEGTGRLGGPLDVDALADYLATHSPVAPGPRDRITRVP